MSPFNLPQVTEGKPLAIMNYYIRPGIELSFEGFYIKGSADITFHPDGFLNFDPTGLLSTVGFGYKTDWVDLGFRHWCVHPVITYLKTNPLNTHVNYEGAYEEIFIQFKLKMGW
jgi:hypothetical protein